MNLECRQDNAYNLLPFYWSHLLPWCQKILKKTDWMQILSFNSSFYQLSSVIFNQIFSNNQYNNQNIVLQFSKFYISSVNSFWKFTCYFKDLNHTYMKTRRISRKKVVFPFFLSSTEAKLLASLSSLQKLTLSNGVFF